MNNLHRLGGVYLFLVISLLIISVGYFEGAISAEAVTITETSAPREAGSASWLEPRGINVADLVGILPEDVLKDSIVTWDVDNGVSQYESGSRVGNTVSLSVHYAVSDKNALFCLGKTVTEDEYPSPVSAMSMRVFDGNTDVTARVSGAFRYTPAGHVQPIGPPNTRFRYAEVTNATFQHNGDGSIQVPANIGCNFTVTGASLTNPRAEFTFESPAYFSATKIYETQTAFHSYIGHGAGGSGNRNFNSLRDQMKAKWKAETGKSFRHDGWKPDTYDDDELRTQLFEADYVFFKFPPQPINPWAHGAAAPGSGTHRFMFSNGAWYHQSVDHSTSTLMPVHTQWRDVSSVGDSVAFLPRHGFFDRLKDSQYQVHDEIKAPEYFLPPGVAYNSCMTNGGCSNSILESVKNTTYPVNIYFYKVERIYPHLTQIPLRLVGNGYSGRAANLQIEKNTPSIAQLEVITIPNVTTKIYLPVIQSPFIIPDDNPNAGCPCGWFDDKGRMFDFVPAP